MNKQVIRAFFLSLIFWGAFAQAQSHKGINFQAVVKSPTGRHPTTAAELTATVQILTINNCVLREETHTAVKMTNGYLNLVVGSGTASEGHNPTPVLTLPQVFDNSTERTGLTCVDAENNVVSTGTTYSPQNWQARKMRLRVNVPDEGMLVADFNLRSVPFAVNAETLNGKTENDFIKVSNSIQQNTVENFFASSVVGQLLDGNYSAPAVADNSVGTDKLVNLGITSEKLADGAVTSSKLGADIGKWDVVGSDVYRQAGKIGVGVNTPSFAVDVAGAVGTAFVAVKSPGGAGNKFGYLFGNGNQGSLVADPSTAAGLRISRTYNGPLLFGTNTNADINSQTFTEQMRLTPSGYLAIGTTFPSGPLAVNPRRYDIGTASQSGNVITGVGTNFTAAMVGSQFIFSNGTNAGTIIGRSSATSLTVSTSQTIAEQAYSIHYLGLNVSTTGNVGIGTNTPQFPLHILSEGANVVFDRYQEGTSANEYVTRKARGTVAGPMAVQLEDQTGGLETQGYDGTAFKANTFINTIIDGAVSSGVVPGRIEFKTADSAGVMGTRMTIKSNGRVGVGTTNPQATLHVEGDIRIGNSGVVCDTANAGSQRYNATDKVMEYCTGTTWTDFNPPGTMCGFYSSTKIQSCKGSMLTAVGGCPAGYVHTKMEPTLSGTPGEFYTCVKN